MSFRISTRSPEIITNFYTTNGSTAYGSFSSDISQTLINDASYAIVHQVQDISAVGVNIDVTGTKIYVSTSGVYKVLSSLQCDSTLGPSKFFMWISINDIAVSNSNTSLLLNTSTESVLTVEWFLELNANDYITIYGTANTGNAIIKVIPAPIPGSPNVPGIITTIMKIS